MAPSPVEEITMIDLDRSNRGASKQRRDQINSEISTMRDLLPLTESARQRLSQLQIMSLSCVYIRKCNILQKMFRSSRPGKDLPCDFFQALTGFILVTTREGKLLYISENVTDFLGHSMVDMKTQGDSLYDIVDKRDHVAVQTQLQIGDINSDVSFYCRMNMSRSLKRQAGFGDVKVMHVRGHFTNVPTHESGSEQQFVFMATCTPLITPELKENLVQNNTMIFKTVHQLDMTFLEMTETAEHHLGYTNENIRKKSWYTLLHPEDIHIAREKHVQLIRSSHEMGCMATVRMIREDGNIIWVNTVMHVRQAPVASNDEPVIVCINQVISEQEAYQFKLQSNSFSLYPLRSGDIWAQGLGNVPTPQTTQWMPTSSNFGQYPSLRRSPTSIADTVSQTSYVQKRGRPSQFSSQSTLQTEKVKRMLQKKIVGCKPAKIPRMSPVESKQTSFQADFGLSTSSNFYFGSFEPFCDSLHIEPFGGTPTQMMSVTNFSMSKSPILQKKEIMVEPCMLNKSACLSPNLLEQVVPDSSLRAPDFTPESSPASSPRHKITEDAFEILEDLTKLEQFQQLQTMKQNVELKKKKKDLPLMDPLDIEHFFERLPIEKEEAQTLPTKPVIKTEKDLLHDFDSSDLEEFFNGIDVSTCQTPLLIKQEPSDSIMQVTGHCFHSPYQQTNSMHSITSPQHNVPSPQSSITEEFSPGSCYTSELSEEELLDELNFPVEMTLSVDVAGMKEEFEALQQTHFNNTGSIHQESELHHLQRLLKELVPNPRTKNLLKDSQ